MRASSKTRIPATPRHARRRTWVWLSVWPLAVLHGTAGADSVVHGVAFDDTVLVAGQRLQLNGAGVRKKLFFSVYVAGLYVVQRDNHAEALLAQPGAKQLHAVLVRDLSASEFGNALIDGFKANNTEADMQTYRERLLSLRQRMIDHGPVHEGSSFDLIYVPGEGAHFAFNGQPMGDTLSGEAFFRDLLRIWLGPHPVDDQLKRALLGEPPT